MLGIAHLAQYLVFSKPYRTTVVNISSKGSHFWIGPFRADKFLRPTPGINRTIWEKVYCGEWLKQMSLACSECTDAECSLGLGCSIWNVEHHHQWAPPGMWRQKAVHINRTVQNSPNLPLQVHVSPVEHTPVSNHVEPTAWKSLICPKHAQEPGWDHSNKIQLCISHNTFCCIYLSVKKLGFFVAERAPNNP